LKSSFDGVLFNFPPEITGRGWYNGSRNDWFHCDQRPNDNGFNSVQGIVNLYPVEPGDATFRFIVGSHQLHSAYFNSPERKTKGNGDYQPMDRNDPLFSGLPTACVTAGAGDIILFDSRVVHMGVQPLKQRVEPNFRAVVPVAMMPVTQITDAALKKRMAYFKAKRIVNHRCDRVTVKGKFPQTYGKILQIVPEVKPLELSHQLLRLI
jgi:hypothetical protein